MSIWCSRGLESNKLLLAVLQTMYVRTYSCVNGLVNSAMYRVTFFVLSGSGNAPEKIRLIFSKVSRFSSRGFSRDHVINLRLPG